MGNESARLSPATNYLTLTFLNPLELSFQGVFLFLLD